MDEYAVPTDKEMAGVLISAMAQNAAIAVNSGIEAAIDTVTDIMTDETQDASIRLQAAKIIFDCAGQLNANR